MRYSTGEKCAACGEPLYKAEFGPPYCENPDCLGHDSGLHGGYFKVRIEVERTPEDDATILKGIIEVIDENSSRRSHD